MKLGASIGGGKAVDAAAFIGGDAVHLAHQRSAKDTAPADTAPGAP